MQTTLTHGVELGVARASSRDLQQATQALIEGFVAGQQRHARRGGRRKQFRLSGRNAIVTPLEGRSALGGVERVDVHTTMLANGDLFYVLTVVPEREDRHLQRGLRSRRPNGRFMIGRERDRIKSREKGPG